MTAQTFWEAFRKKRTLPPQTPWSAWAFGGDPDRLAQLVLTGEKTATSSAFPLYVLEQEPLPQAGDYSVILNSQNEAVCVIQTVRVAVVPFCQVSSAHALREGEGDKSLAYWREVHRAFFQVELAQAGLSFGETMPVVCEEFEVLDSPYSGIYE